VDILTARLITSMRIVTDSEFAYSNATEIINHLKQDGRSFKETSDNE
jgi:predicted transcriptional regulator